MTDGDHGVSDDEDKEDDEEGASEGDAVDDEADDVALLPGERRKHALDKLAKSNGAEAVLAAITSRYSLESELLEAGNGPILRAAYLTLHKRSRKKWDAAAALEGDARAKAINKIFKDARKGDFAQVLADLIENIPKNGQRFVVPPYIDQTIRDVVA